MGTKAKIAHIDEVKAHLEAGETRPVRDILADMHGADIGKLLAGLSEPEAAEVFRLLEPEEASEVLLEVDEHLRKALISAISSDELIEVVEEMETDDAADVISELPIEDARQVLDNIEEAAQVQKLLVYPEDSAGGKMQTELACVAHDATVQETIEEVRRKSREIENISNVFVVDSEMRLIGTVALDKLILASPETLIRDVADTDPIKVQTDLDQEEVAKIFQKYDLVSVPVVDAADRLVGRITIDDVVDVIEDEIFEDFYKMAALNIEARALDPAIRSIKTRVPWLMVNLATAAASASVVKFFQGTIEQLVVLAVLMPIVAGVGGNAATQTITVVVRGLALGEITLKNARWLLFKEALVGLANGLLVGGVAAIVAYLIGAAPTVGLLLFLAMTANMIIAGLVGSLMPLILKSFRIDPAISSSIFVTACTDISGFFTFLGLATVFMHLKVL